MRRRAGRPSSCALRAAIFGPDANRTGRAPCADSCDTDFLGTDGPGGGSFDTGDELAASVAEVWPADDRHGPPYVVCTGGEPLLQLDAAAIDALHARGFEVGVETNGTIAAPPGIDWLCVSPKADADLVQIRGDELKLVYPQAEAEAQPERFAELDFDHFYLQPLDDATLTEHTAAAIRYCLSHPQWKLSVQTHKLIGIP